MVKAYLRYEHHSAFGVVASGPVVAEPSGRLLVAAALENVVLWNVKSGQAVRHPPELMCLETASAVVAPRFHLP